MTDPQGMEHVTAERSDIAMQERDYYIGRVRQACAAAEHAADPAIARIHLTFAAKYLVRLLASVEKQIA